jgi:hypothetical protein
MCKKCYQTNYSKKRRRKRKTNSNTKNCSLARNYNDENCYNDDYNDDNDDKNTIDNYIKINNEFPRKTKKRELSGFFNTMTPPLGSSNGANSANAGMYCNSKSGNSGNSRHAPHEEKFTCEDLIPQRVNADFDYLNSSNLYMVNNEKVDSKNDVDYNMDYNIDDNEDCGSGSSNYSDFVNFI